MKVSFDLKVQSRVEPWHFTLQRNTEADTITYESSGLPHFPPFSKSPLPTRNLKCKVLSSTHTAEWEILRFGSRYLDFHKFCLWFEDVIVMDLWLGRLTWLTVCRKWFAVVKINMFTGSSWQSCIIFRHTETICNLLHLLSNILPGSWVLDFTCALLTSLR